MSEQSKFASASVPRHLARGAVGFGLIGSAFGLTAAVGPAALLLAPLGMVALRGCPMCWTAGLIETVSAGRLRRSCGPAGCTLERAPQEQMASLEHERRRERTPV
ncbi:MAG TPA: hypothetical protein VGN25_01130 [Solirubrobacteraceae bacterium]|jgi:hypothetical protein|nr:hypothetical protein [Solirubrobacteraceae bacterium]